MSETAKKRPVIDHESWQDFSCRHGLNMTVEEIERAVRGSSADPEEGEEWLPFYKAALCCLAECIGELVVVTAAQNQLNATVHSRIKRLWFLHLVLCGVGPRTDDVSRTLDFVKNETEKCFPEAPQAT